MTDLPSNAHTPPPNPAEPFSDEQLHYYWEHGYRLGQYDQRVSDLQQLHTWLSEQPARRINPPTPAARRRQLAEVEGELWTVAHARDLYRQALYGATGGAETQAPAAGSLSDAYDELGPASLDDRPAGHDRPPGEHHATNSARRTQDGQSPRHWTELGCSQPGCEAVAVAVEVDLDDDAGNEEWPVCFEHSRLGNIVDAPPATVDPDRNPSSGLSTPSPVRANSNLAPGVGVVRSPRTQDSTHQAYRSQGQQAPTPRPRL